MDLGVIRSFITSFSPSLRNHSYSLPTRRSPLSMLVQQTFRLITLAAVMLFPSLFSKPTSETATVQDKDQANSSPGFDGVVSASKPSMKSTRLEVDWDSKIGRSSKQKSFTCWPGAFVQDSHSDTSPQIRREGFSVPNFRRPNSYSRTMHPELSGLKLKDFAVHLPIAIAKPYKRLDLGWVSNTRSSRREALAPVRMMHKNEVWATPTRSSGDVNSFLKSLRAGTYNVNTDFFRARKEKIEITATTKQPQIDCSAPDGSRNPAWKSVDHLERNRPTPKDKAAVELKPATSKSKGAEKPATNATSTDVQNSVKKPPPHASGSTAKTPQLTVNKVQNSVNNNISASSGTFSRNTGSAAPGLDIGSKGSGKMVLQDAEKSATNATGSDKQNPFKKIPPYNPNTPSAFRRSYPLLLNRLQLMESNRKKNEAAHNGKGVVKLAVNAMSTDEQNLAKNSPSHDASESKAKTPQLATIEVQNSVNKNILASGTKFSGTFIRNTGTAAPGLEVGSKESGKIFLQDAERSATNATSSNKQNSFKKIPSYSPNTPSAFRRSYPQLLKRFQLMESNCKKKNEAAHNSKVIECPDGDQSIKKLAKNRTFDNDDSALGTPDMGNATPGPDDSGNNLLQDVEKPATNAKSSDEQNSFNLTSGSESVLPSVSIVKPDQWLTNSNASTAFTFSVDINSGILSEPPSPSILEKEGKEDMVIEVYQADTIMEEGREDMVIEVYQADTIMEEGREDMIIDVYQADTIMNECVDASSSTLGPLGRGLKRNIGCLDVIAKTNKMEDDYILGDSIGAGTYGSVCLCRSKATGVDFACKTLRKDEETAQREVEIMQHLSGHPGIVTLQDLYEESDRFHLVMELCPGGSLINQMEEEGMYSEQRAANILKDLMSIIKYCHDLGVVHRDIKPDNILFSSLGEMKLADFGVSARISDGKTLSGLNGSRSYVAPEVLTRDYSEKVDIWSVGVLLHALLVDDRPFKGSSDEEIFEAIKNQKLDFNNGIWETVSKPARDLIGRMLTRDVSARLTADEVLRHPWISFYTESSSKMMPFISKSKNKDGTKLDKHRLQALIRNEDSEISSLSESLSCKLEEQDELGIVDALAIAISDLDILEPTRSRGCASSSISRKQRNMTHRDLRFGVVEALTVENSRVNIRRQKRRRLCVPSSTSEEKFNMTPQNLKFCFGVTNALTMANSRMKKSKPKRSRVSVPSSRSKKQSHRISHNLIEFGTFRMNISGPKRSRLCVTTSCTREQQYTSSLCQAF